MSTDERRPTSVPTSSFRRGLRITRLGVLGTARAAAHAMGNAFRPESERPGREATLWRDQAAMWVREVGQLKGSLMKAGQMLAMYGEHFLPPEAVAILSQLQSDAPPVAVSSIEAVLAQDLSPAARAQLQLEAAPCGAASLGQVHRATLEDGTQVAVKVQYPGIREALDADLRALRRLLTLMRVVARGDTVEALFAEVREVLHDELDYARERRMTDGFRDALAGDDRYVVPRTFAHLCGARVLTTSFEAGVDADGPEVRALSQARRNALGLSFFELYLRELFVWRRVQTDPHFGNFRVRLGDGAQVPDRLVLLDFGAVRPVSDGYLRAYRRMMLGCLHDDREQILDTGLELGLMRPGDSADAEQAFFDLARLIAEPFSAECTPNRDHKLFDAETGAYDFGRSDLPRRVAQQATAFGRAVGLRASPPESLFLDRKLAGVFLFMSRLGVVANGDALLRHYLEADPEARSVAAGAQAFPAEPAAVASKSRD